MSKELEALERLSKCLTVDYDKEAFNIIKQCLEAIDNAKPSEALKCLEDIYRNAVFVKKEYASEPVHNSSYSGHYKLFGESWETHKTISEQCTTIKQALIKAQEKEELLEIIKRVYTDLCFILSFDTFEEYDRSCDLVSVQVNLKRVNKEEFELLKSEVGE